MSNEMKHEEKKLIHQLFWRSFALEGSFNYEKMQALGFAWAMFPAIKLYCKTPQEQVEALKRHTAFFNITPNICTFSLGMAASMEKEYAQKKDMDPATINAVKVSLMGPLSGIGDSFFWGILRVIAAGIGISLASTGSPLGAIVFLLLYNVPAFLIHYYALYSGYSIGESFIQKMYESGGMKILTKVSSMLGLMMMGSMTASNVKFKTILEVSVKGSKDVVKIQDYLDQLFVGIVPLAVTLLAFWLLRKKVNVNVVMFGIMFLGILLGLLGIC